MKREKTGERREGENEEEKIKERRRKKVDRMKDIVGR